MNQTHVYTCPLTLNLNSSHPSRLSQSTSSIFNFTFAVSVQSDFGAQEKSCNIYILFQILFPFRYYCRIMGGLPWWLGGKESAYNVGDLGSIPKGRKIPLEKGMATHSSILAWRIPWTEEPGGLQSIGSQRVRHDWSDWEHTHKSSVVRIMDNFQFHHLCIESKSITPGFPLPLSAGTGKH